jgi:eight-cysteine-cluster-containing protein
MSKTIIVIIIIIIVVGLGYWVYQSAITPITPEGLTKEEKACLNFGGQVSTSLCCKSTNDFPNLCLIGACGCSPENSHQVKICDCGPDKCFDGKECVSLEELMTVKVFFSNSQLDPEFSCNKVFPVEREMSETLGVEKAVLEELFKGPTEEEKSQGYVSWFSQETKDILKSVKIENDTAYVDLKDIRQIIPNVSSSCGSVEFLTEVETTLKQFSAVDRVIIAIEGKPETFYEWIQIGCAKENDFCDEAPFKASNGESKENSTYKEDFCGNSTFGNCVADTDCVTGGCSREVCQSRSEEPIITTCEYKDCYNTQVYNLKCGCAQNKCQWIKIS